MVALWSAAQGNVFAPFFAVLDVMVVGAALRLVWRSGECAGWIELSDDTLTVRREARGCSVEAARFHPYWVRLGPAPQGHPRVIRVRMVGRSKWAPSSANRNARRWPQRCGRRLDI